jgi:fructosamine-3-kinase
MCPMSVNEALKVALRTAGTDARIVRTRDLSGGCIHQVVSLTLDDGSRIVAKINRADQIRVFEEEVNGLKALAATRTVLVPFPLVVCTHGNVAVLLMNEIDLAPASNASWTRLGEELAALHHAPAGDRYGFDIDNHIGSTVQPNSWHDDWVEFNTVNRLGFQLDLAVQSDLLDAAEAKTIQIVIDHLERFIPRNPKPALLHGDLWSGNSLPATDDRIAVIDPACSIGDGWADVAMMKLFGGFPQTCLDAHARNQSDRDNIEQRMAVYQLYHVLNHVNIFGRGYVGQAISLARTLT